MTEENNLPALIDRASRCLMDARSSGEFLEARKIAQAALHYARVTKAANETHADCLRIIVRAEMRLADAVDDGQESGEVAKAGGDTSIPRSPGNATLDEIGIPSQRLAEWRDLRDAGHDAVEAAIQQQLNEGRAPTKSGIKAALAGFKANNEWYTPAEWIDRARAAMGSIDCDPATTEFAQQTVKATQRYDKGRDGLQQRWHGNVWLNPPYARGQIESFIEKLIAERQNYRQAIVLVDNRTDTAWFHSLCSIADAVAFTKGRIGFYNDDIERSSPANGSAFIYIGNRQKEFEKHFGSYCIVLIHPLDNLPMAA